MWQEVKNIQTSGECFSYLDAIDIWTNKPHVVNRHLCGAKILWQYHGNSHIIDILEDPHKIEYFDKKASQVEQEKLLNHVMACLKKLVGDDAKECKLYIRDLLPKSLDKFAVLREIVLVDITNSDSYFIPHELTGPSGNVICVTGDQGYRIQLGEDKKRVTLYVRRTEGDTVQNNLGYTLEWLQSSLLPKIASWSTTPHLNTAIVSLRLVPVDHYNQLYQQLKKKYGAPLVKVWPERTDPQKFIYEDVAIAAYLLLLWEDDRKKKSLKNKQSFVDLGCGNGLLVYILSSEGHPGLGLDLRRRKIWDLFGEKFDLQEREITPSDENLFPEYDWLIGNHSDELTPWIPVMAARSSYESCYFVLPCCPHDFSAKFNQKVTGTSQYRAYLEFVQEVGQSCGFDVEEDTLRIPSTKRVCFIGRVRSYKPEEELAVDAKRQAYIDHRCSLTSNKHHKSKSVKLLAHDQHETSEECEELSVGCRELASNNKEHFSTKSQNPSTSANHDSQLTTKRNWIGDFRVRDCVQKPRNCVTVPSNVKEKITRIVFDKLLHMEVRQLVPFGNDKVWNQGGSLPLSDVASLFDQVMLQQLKSECGGLQTLLRNSHHIFRVQSGRVQLRDWTTDDYDEHQKNKRRKKGKAIKEDSAKLLKTKLCFFYDHHPDGCPLSDDICRFAHGRIELRTVAKTSPL